MLLNILPETEAIKPKLYTEKYCNYTGSTSLENLTKNELFLFSQKLVIFPLKNVLGHYFLLSNTIKILKLKQLLLTGENFINKIMKKYAKNCKKNMPN